jgi:hypothetical protein
MTESQNYVIKAGFLLRNFSIITVVVIIIIIIIIIVIIIIIIILNGLASYVTLYEKKYLG